MFKLNIILLLILSLPIFTLISTVIIKEVKYIVAAQRIKTETLKMKTKVPSRLAGEEH